MKVITILILCFTTAAMAAHAYRQPSFNELDKVAAEEEAYRRSAIVGYVRMDAVTQELVYEAK